MDSRVIHVRWVHLAVAAIGVAALATVLVFAIRTGREMGHYLETSTGLRSNGDASTAGVTLPLPPSPAMKDAPVTAPAPEPAETPQTNEDAADLRPTD